MAGFKDIVGNEQIIEHLQNAISMGKVSHAYIINGPQLSGKMMIAEAFARALQCEKEGTDGCGECKSCHQADDHNHPDIIYVSHEKPNNISVDDIRTQLNNDIVIKPYSSKYKIYIVDEAEKMNQQAQNALLKVLEEPPGSVLFVLIAENKAALLDTVISRCTVFSLSPPEISEAEKYLAAGEEFPPERISSALREAGGNIGVALAYLSGSSDKAAAAAEEFISLLLASDELGMLKMTSRFEKNRVEADAFLRELKLAAASSLKKNLSNPLTARTLSVFYSELDGFEQSLTTNVNLSLLFAALVCKATEIS